MGKLQSIWTARCREVYVQLSLLLLMSTATMSAFGQACPTSDVTLNVTNADFAAGRVCGGTSTGGCTTFNFTFPTASATCATTLTFTPSQGCGGSGGNLDVYNNVGGVCTPVPVSGGGVVTITNITTPNYTIVVCRPGNGPAALQGLSATSCCTPAVTCPTLTPAAVSCAAAIPAAATTASEFLALGGGATITDCGQPVEVSSTDSPLDCNSRNLTRTYTIIIGTFSRTCSIIYPILAPVITIANCPAPTSTVSCAVNVPAVSAAVTATSNCGGTVTVTANDVETNRTCANRYTVTRTYTATDACNNTATCAQVITVNDVTPPVLAGTAVLPNIGCNAALPTAAESVYTATDNCTVNVTPVASDWSVDVTTACNITYRRTWTATDGCNPATTVIQRITRATTAGAITFAGTLNLGTIAGCNAGLPSPTQSVLTASNACGTYTASPAAWVPTGTVNCLVTYTRTWTANDGCGTTTTAVQTIRRIEDNVAPVLAGTATLPNIVCGATLPTATESVFTATDACGGSSTVSVGAWVSTNTNCGGNIYKRVWTATDVCGNSSTKEQTIACNATLSCATTKLRDANCDGFNGSATVTLTGGVAATYNWDTNETTATATQLNQGLHNVTVTSTAGCITICSVFIGNTTNLECSVIQNGSASCNGANGSATVTATGGTSNIRFVWDNGETTATATALTAGTHTVQVISGNCRKTCSVTITTTGENLRMGACAKTDATCGATNGSVEAGVISGQAGTLSFTWRNAANQIVGTTERVTNLAAGVYTLTLKDACATVTCSVTIGSTGADATCTATQKKAAGCADNDGSATVTVAGGTGTYTYSWDNGETTATATQLWSGLHYVTVTSAAGCESTCSVTIGSPVSTLYCSTTQTATTATVTIIGGNGIVTILWDNGETTATAIHLSPGVHSVVLTDQAGCTTGCSVTIAGDALSCTTSAVKHLKCSKDSDGSAKVTVKGGTAPYKILWDNGETTAIATNLNIGEHTVTVTDSKGETTTCSISIGCTAASLTMAACTKTDVTCKGENTGSVTAGAVQGTGKLEYTWKDAAHKVVGKTATVNHLRAGTYTLIVQNGCSSATCTVTVEQPTEVCEEKEYHFYPAATTCCTYANGSSQALKQIGYKSNERITQVNPNVFFYYAKIVAPSKDFTVNVVQTKDVSSFKFLGLNNDQIQLWNAKCSNVAKGISTSAGQGKVSIKNAKVGETYILAVRLDTRTLLNTVCKKEAPKVTYTLASYINNVLVAGSKGSIQLKPNHEQPRLNAGKCSKKAPEADDMESLVNNSLSVQPNPAQSTVNVLFESVEEEGSVISIANINGAVVQTMNYEAKQGENNVSLEIQSLPVGAYMVTVQTARQFRTKPLVILR